VPNAFGARDPPRTPLGELTALPRPLSWILGGGKEGRRGKGKVDAIEGRGRAMEMREGQGEAGERERREGRAGACLGS